MQIPIFLWCTDLKNPFLFFLLISKLIVQLIYQLGLNKTLASWRLKLLFVWFSILLFSACTRWERAENTYKAILEKDPVDSVSASFSSILGYFDWLDLCDAKLDLGWWDCRKQNSTITIVVINAFCYLKKYCLCMPLRPSKRLFLSKI